MTCAPLHDHDSSPATGSAPSMRVSSCTSHCMYVPIPSSSQTMSVFARMPSLRPFLFLPASISRKSSAAMTQRSGGALLPPWAPSPRSLLALCPDIAGTVSAAAEPPGCRSGKGGAISQRLALSKSAGTSCRISPGRARRISLPCTTGQAGPFCCCGAEVGGGLGIDGTGDEAAPSPSGAEVAGCVK